MRGCCSVPKLLLVFLITALGLFSIAFYSLKDSLDTTREHTRDWATGSIGHEDDESYSFDRDLLHGEVVMGKLGNETAKAEVGRASWKLLHTMAARFPLKPTPSEREAFSSFLYLFSRMYPCGECALEFQTLLKLHPPQTSSRTAASTHLCFLHNQVNERLGKPEFDCGVGLEGLYDCGCGDEEPVDGVAVKGAPKKKNNELVADIEEEKSSNKNKKKILVDREEEVDGKMRDPATGHELIGG